MLNVKAILDRFESAITDNTAEMRSRSLIWLNMIFQRIAQERNDWSWLQKTEVLDIANSQITLPADCKRVLFMEDAAHRWRLTDKEKASQQEISRMSLITAESPTAFSVQGCILTLWPNGTTSTTANVTYTQTVPEYVDDTADTLFPDEASLLIHRSLMASFYEYDFDERSALGGQMASIELKKFKEWENDQNPYPHYYTATTVTNYAP